MNTGLFNLTPAVNVLDNRNLLIRDIAYHRHPDSPEIVDERTTRHQFDTRGFLSQSADPRLHEVGLANVTYLTDLAGSTLYTQGADNGTMATLNDAAGRPFIRIEETVTRRYQYEEATLPGRMLSLTEQIPGEAVRISERFLYAGSTDVEKALNLAGMCIRHYDTAGLFQINSLALTDVPLSFSRRLLLDGDDPDLMPDWQSEDASTWDKLLDAETFTTLTTTDATGSTLATLDAKGNRQRVEYDVAGLLSCSWLTLKGGTEQAIVKSLTYSAAGQKLREEQGNGVVTTYTYEAETQRLTGIITMRPVGHAAGAKVLQDLRYDYDPVGNVLSVRNDAEETRFWRNQKVVPENRYLYDSLYQLVSATGREMASVGQQSSRNLSVTVPLPTDSSAYTCYTRAYAYDSGGNLIQIRHSAPATGNNYTTTLTVSHCSNRAVLSSLATDPSDVDAFFMAGGQQKQLQPGQSLSWTLRNALLKVTSVVRDGAMDDRENYRYDGGNQRVLKVSTQKTGGSMQIQKVRYLPGLELRTTTSGSTETENLQAISVGNGGRTQVRALHWENGRPEGISNNLIRYSYGDLTGSMGMELDRDGNVISMEAFYPYGGTSVWTARNAVEADYKAIRYSGKERDATGLYDYGYRYYQPWVGRWLSADPAGTVDGLNLFRMCRNNPLSNIDISGHVTIPAAIHFAWEGKDIPVDAMKNILFAMHVSGYDVNVWTSRPGAIYSTLEKMKASETLAYERYLAYNFGNYLNVQDTHSLYADLKANHPAGTQLEAMYHREISGAYRNYAAASDITRGALMFEKGGIYMDTDVVACSAGRLADIISESSHNGFFYTLDGKSTSNAVLASARHSQRSKILLDMMSQSLKKIDLYKDQASWTTKRSLQDDASVIGRLKGTTHTTGPSLLQLFRRDDNGANTFPEDIFDCRVSGDTEISLDTLMDESPVTLVTRGLRVGLDGRGCWVDARPGRRDSV